MHVGKIFLATVLEVYAWWHYTYRQEIETLHASTCLLVPFPYSITDTAHCARPNLWCLDFKSCGPIRLKNGLCSSGL